MLALPVFAKNKGLVLPTWLRWMMRLTTLPLALAALAMYVAIAVLGLMGISLILMF